METETSDFAAEFIKKTLHQRALYKLRLEPTDSQWVGRVGDFVVVDDDRVTLETPAKRMDGGFLHPAPPGTHPVYAVSRDKGEPGAPHFRVTHLFLPFAPWEQVADASWERVNDSRGAFVRDCACLWTRRSKTAALRRWADDKGDSLSWIEEAVGSADVLARPGNYPSEIADPDSGANILAFPVAPGFVDGYTARNDRGDLRAVMLWVEPG